MPAIEQSIDRRMQKCGIDTPRDYLRIVQSSPEEQAALIDEITVCETWFFREFKAFSLLQKFALQRLKTLRGRRPLRIASMPCSTGEEPYSIAITLLNAGVDSQHFAIDAIDINRDAVEAARRGRYQRLSFRGTIPDFLQHYFTKDTQKSIQEFHLCDLIKKTVRFHLANLLSPGDDFLAHQYDIVFCRNFLIYLDPCARKRLVANLKRALAPEAVLVVGHCEVPYIASQGFTYLSTESKSGFTVTPTASEPATKPLVVKKSQKLPVTPLSKSPPKHAPIPADRSPNKPSDSIALLEALANNGDLANSEKGCRALLQKHPDNIDAIFLLGLIRETKGDWKSANEHFRKVLYLQADHCEALLHSAFVFEQQGNTNRAKSLRARLKRTAKLAIKPPGTT